MVGGTRGPRTLARKPRSVSVPIPLILDEEDLVELLHKKQAMVIGYCNHSVDGHGNGKACEALAEELMHSGAIQKADVFIGSLKDNETVQGIILEAMADAWDEGHSSTVDGEDNPYG